MRRTFLSLLFPVMIFLSLSAGCSGPSVTPGANVRTEPVAAESLQVAYSDGRFGYIDPEGNMVIEPRFDIAYIFRDGLAPVRTGDKWGFIDLSLIHI